LRPSATIARCARRAANRHGSSTCTGIIATGYLADITVLDTDLTTCEPQRIRDAKVLRTIVGGRTHFGETG
jgi:predicted amidohydrolase YtcJ